MNAQLEIIKILTGVLEGATADELYQAFYAIGCKDIENLVGIRLLVESAFSKLTKGDKNGN